MIIILGNNQGKRLLGFGLSRENLKRLSAGDPIFVTHEKHGDAISKHEEYLIFFGETELQMKEQFEAAGIIGPQTKVEVGSSGGFGA